MAFLFKCFGQYNVHPARDREIRRLCFGINRGRGSDMQPDATDVRPIRKYKITKLKIKTKNIFLCSVCLRGIFIFGRDLFLALWRG